MALSVVGVVLVIVPLAVQVAGAGGSDDFGWKQTLAVAVGALAAAAGMSQIVVERSESPAASHVRYAVVIVLGGAALRFATLDQQSFWGDELITVRVLREPFAESLASVADRNTPFMYYLVGWFWTRVFGDSEVGLRSLSALLGTATIPLIYLAARSLISRRAGLLAAGLTAVSPVLVWYSQEARTYAMLTFFAALSFLFFVRSLDEPRTRNLAGWAAASALALMTHWFAIFVIAAEGVLLLARAGSRRRAVGVACGAVAACGLALLPLALHQAGRISGENNWVANLQGSLLDRLVSTAEAFLVYGVSVTAEVSRPLPPLLALGIAAVLLIALGLWLVVARGTSRERRRTGIAAAVAVGAIGLPVVLALAGKDYVFHRNLLGAWPAIGVTLAAAFSVKRAGRLALAAGVALCAWWLVLTVSIMSNPIYQRDDWRGVAAALDRPAAFRAVLLQGRGRSATAAPPTYGPLSPPPFTGTPLGHYYHSFNVQGYPGDGYEISEILLVDFREFAFRREGEPFEPTPPRGFSVARLHDGGNFRIFWLRAPVARRVTPTELARVPPRDRSGTANRVPQQYLQRPSPGA